MLLTNKQHNDIVESIIAQRDEVVYRESISRRWYVVYVDGVGDVVAVFDPSKYKKGQYPIHTFLPIRYLYEKLHLMTTEHERSLAGWEAEEVTLYRESSGFPGGAVRGTLDFIENGVWSVSDVIFRQRDVKFVFPYRPNRLYIELHKKDLSIVWNKKESTS